MESWLVLSLWLETTVGANELSFYTAHGAYFATRSQHINKHQNVPILLIYPKLVLPEPVQACPRPVQEEMSWWAE